METRVTRLENDMSEIKSDLKLLLIGFAEIKGALKGMASAEALGEMKGTISELRGTTASAEALGDLKATVSELKGRVDALPTTANLSSVIGLATAVIVVLNNWSLLKTWLVG